MRSPTATRQNRSQVRGSPRSHAAAGPLLVACSVHARSAPLQGTQVFSLNQTGLQVDAEVLAAESDAEALSWCREWVSGLQAFVMNLDHQVGCCQVKHTRREDCTRSLSLLVSYWHVLRHAGHVTAGPLQGRRSHADPQHVVRAVQSLRVQVDTMLQREAAAQLPGNWCTFAQNCVMQLRDLEDAMQVLLWSSLSA